jgi:transcriptional regulator with XRE-family HTH domain
VESDKSFPELLTARMIKRGLTRKVLAEKINRTQEHVRKLEKGEAFPGPDLQQKLADVLRVDAEVLTDTVARDRWRQKYGKRPPRRQAVVNWPLQRVWEGLTADQRDELICVAKCMAKRNQTRRGNARERTA